MEETPTVSVVLPTYNRGAVLSGAIETVLAQTHEPVDLVVVDGSGEAHARPVADEYEVTYLTQERDRGPHAAWCVGAGLADGAYVQFLDDDDRLRPGKFAAQIPRFRDEDVGVVYSGLVDEEWGVDDPVPRVEGRKYLLRRYAHLYRELPASVRRTAVSRTHHRAGNKHLEESRWSAGALASFARAAYHAPEETPWYAATAAASLFGRPGLHAVERLGVAP